MNCAKKTDDWYIYQQGTYAPADGQYRWMGSIAMNGNGDIALGYSLASTTTYPSIYYVGRRADAPLGEMNLPEIEIIGGTGSQSGIDRWGDYSCLSVDPSDDSTFWFTTEYHENRLENQDCFFRFRPYSASRRSMPEMIPLFVKHESFQADAQASYQQSVTWYSSGMAFFWIRTKIQAVYLRGAG